MSGHRVFEWLAVARSLAMEAGGLIRSASRSARSSGETAKSNSVDLVTEFDRRADEIIIVGIRKLYPEHSIISEESCPDAPLAEITWIIDPIDGTTNFIAGLPEVAVSIGIAINGVVHVGVVYNPIRNEIFHAVRGFGAFLDDLPIRVNADVKITEWKPWDYAAGSLIAVEAGAQLCKVDGSEFDLFGDSVVCSVPSLLPKILEIIKVPS